MPNHLILQLLASRETSSHIPSAKELDMVLVYLRFISRTRYQQAMNTRYSPQRSTSTLGKTAICRVLSNFNCPLYDSISPEDFKRILESVLRGKLSLDYWNLIRPLLEKLRGECHFVKGKFRVELNRQGSEINIQDRRQTWQKEYNEMMKERVGLKDLIVSLPSGANVYLRHGPTGFSKSVIFTDFESLIQDMAHFIVESLFQGYEHMVGK